MESFVVFMQQWFGEELIQLTQGHEVVKWIEYELETLIPQLEITDSDSDQNDLTNIIRKAQVLAETYNKRVMQGKAENFRNPFNIIIIGTDSRKLHKIRDEITQARQKFLKSAKHARLVSPLSAPENQQRIPFYLRRCIHYFVLFLRDVEVPARRLVALWIAEGFVHSKKHDNESEEHIAQRYLDELINLGIIVIKPNPIGKVKTCAIAAARRDAVLEEATKALQDRDGEIRRQLVVDRNGNDAATALQIDGKPKKKLLSRVYRDVTTLLSFNTQEGSKPGKDIGDFLRKCISARCFIWLNVLDLERVFRPRLPDTLGALIALKYLGLRWTYLEKLPGTVDRLLNLQVLDVKHTYISVLPSSLWRMEYLRHLYLSEAYRTRFPNPTSKVTLTALQTLWGAFVDKDTRVKEGLDRLLNIRKLGLSCRSRASGDTQMAAQLEAIDKWISRLKHLETLRLKSRDENNEAADLHLTSLERNQNLSTVYLLGKLKISSILCELPACLIDITLSGSELNLDPMRFLGSLPNLMILRLLDRSVVQNENFCCLRRGFRKLKVLWIWQLESLKKFEAEEESLPCLEELEIRSCKNLIKLPDRLQQLRNLKVVRLTGMPADFVQREEIKYADVAYVLKYDQCILRNTRTAA
ncbi:disease resistance protein RPM1-like [Salvia miltiorrhiza]|uniref:disease resistance protein RPM1-like n=1 Tax=Salvia miltiorrhiza TaxID=226208 RepID=UPI0025AD91A6|nr:disease resistance protein RPM1-like [Salvia miltiorrhiza]